MGNLTDLTKGRIVKLNDEPYVITWSEFNRQQQRKPVMRTKLKNVRTGASLDKTFLAGESFELANVNRQKVQYLYKDDSAAYFMDETSYEQFQVSLDIIEDSVDYLLEGSTVDGVFFEDNMISIELPPKMVFSVVETTPGVKGDTVSGGKKPATLDSGKVVQVPLFINEGDKVRVNTDTGEYVERA